MGGRIRAFVSLLICLLALSLFSPDFIPGFVTTDNKIALLLFGIGWGLLVLTWNLALTAILWVVVAAVALGNGGQVSRQLLRRRAA